MMRKIFARQVFAGEVRQLRLLGSLLVVLLFLLAIFITLGSFTVEGYSMEPTIYDGQGVMKFRVAYWFGSPQRGDVITFDHPQEERGLIKRVIALPGEWVQVTKDYVYINGEPLEEPYIKGENRPVYPRTQVPEDSYFVMGDNRSHSTDSRVWGMVPRENITGRAWLVYWPLSDCHLIGGYDQD
jgi:signal peptidase I